MHYLIRMPDLCQLTLCSWEGREGKTKAGKMPKGYVHVPTFHDGGNHYAMQTRTNKNLTIKKKMKTNGNM